MKSGKVLIKAIIAIFPICLIGMVIVSALLYDKRRQDVTPENPMTRSVSVPNMVGHYKKLRDFMSPRGFESDLELLHLTRTTSFVAGSIGEVNTGMNVTSDTALTRAERLWKFYAIEFGESVKGGEEQELVVNYVDASNAEVTVALMIAEALPQKEIKGKLVITFSPTEESSPLIARWVSDAQKAGEGSSLNEDGYDWTYLQAQIQSYIEGL